MVDEGEWRPVLLVAESAYLMCYHTRQRDDADHEPLQGAMGVYPLVEHWADLPSYEGTVRSRVYTTEAAADRAGARLQSDHAVTWRQQPGAFVVLDGTDARPGGMQNINAHGSTRVPLVHINAERDLTQVAAFTPIQQHMTLLQLANAELLTDYHARFWALTRRAMVVATQLSRTACPLLARAAIVAARVEAARAVARQTADDQLRRDRDKYRGAQAWSSPGSNPDALISSSRMLPKKASQNSRNEVISPCIPCSV
jgi:hypothetical protein